MRVSCRNLVLALAPLVLAMPSSAKENQEAVELGEGIEGAADVEAQPGIVVEGEPDPTVCKSFAPPTASRIARKKKVCKLHSEWEFERRELARRNREIMDGEAGSTRTNLSDAFNSASGRDRADPSPPR